MNASACRRIGEASRDRSPQHPHQELRDALAGVRQLYCDDGSKEQLLKALDRLARSAQAHFGAEEQRLRRQGSDRLDAQLAAHQNIVDYIVLVRQYVERFDKFGLLQELHFLDYWLRTEDGAAEPQLAHGGRQRRLPPAAPRG